MHNYTLEITLLSDTTFNMGAGISGVVDAEIQHDELGLPTISGRAIKGLLVNECSELLYALGEGKDWSDIATQLFGIRGETLGGEMGKLHISDATIAPDLVESLRSQKTLSRLEIIDSLTDVRRQTAMNVYGAPKDESLRANRVLIKGITLYASLNFTKKPADPERALLAACVLSMRQAGLGRNRGKGKIRVRITDRRLKYDEFIKDKDPNDITAQWFPIFKRRVGQ